MTNTMFIIKVFVALLDVLVTNTSQVLYTTDVLKDFVKYFFFVSFKKSNIESVQWLLKINSEYKKRHDYSGGISY